ncbi:hypothetical protein ACHAXR_004114, partial [Thalassiosira sp. AJA248-18]
MTMAISRRPARKSEPNLNSIRQIDTSSPRRYNGPGEENATERRRRSWFWPSMRSSKITPPSSPASLYRPATLRSLLGDRLKSCTNRRNMAILLICSLLALLYGWSLIKTWGLGPRGSIKGGQLGYLLDQFGRDYTRYKTISNWREEVRLELDIPIVYKEKEGALLEPWFYPFDVIIKTRPNCAIIEMLLREKSRIKKLGSMVQKANVVIDQCSSDRKYQVEIPTTVLQLLPNQEQLSLTPYWVARSGSIDIDSIAIRNSDINTSLSQAIKSCHTAAANNHATSAGPDLKCVAHHLGGIQLNNSFALHQSRPLVSRIFSLMGSPITNPLHNTLRGGSCNSRVGYAVFSNAPTLDDQLRKTSAISSHVSTVFAAFPPDHPGSLCIPPLEDTIGISPYNEANEELSFQSTLVNKLITEIESSDFSKTSSRAWGIATLPCGYDRGSENIEQNCCNQVSVALLDSIDVVSIEKHLKNEDINENNNKQRHHIIFTSSTVIPSTHTTESSNAQSNPVSVEISELSDNVKPVRRQKESIQMKLRNGKCEPGWFCNRCLQSSIYGSFSKCTFACSKCAINSICNEKDSTSQASQVKIDIQVSGLHFPNSNTLVANNAAQRNRIPRIIHQTYFEEITIEKYPQLLRVQNTWRASGWEYRFYSDETARQFIESNYPPRFVSVFDSLLPGAYKADFFRCLVLYKEGGIYVDVDVMLNTNLDSFIAPDLAFFAPLDAVGSFADEQFCVWNGLLGSAPAHPALTNIIEWMVNLVSSRGDMYDMERTVCRFSGVDKIENWKVRAEPGLMLSGPCALGLALNNALGNEPLSKFSPGLVKRNEPNENDSQDLDGDAIGDAIGNVMILVADKDDLGAFRFSDPERNIIIASTDLAGLSKSPMIYERKDFNSKG